MKNTITFLIARHGETEANVKKIMQGSAIDTPLTEKGIKQAKELGNKLVNEEINVICTSNAQRTKDTANIIAKQLKVPIQIVHSSHLQERNMGKLDGQPYTIFDNELKNPLNEYKELSQEEKFKTNLLDMESDKSVADRLIKYLRELFVTFPNKTLLIITSAGVIKSFLQYIEYAEYDQLPHNSVPPTSYIKLDFDGENFTIVETEGIQKAS